MYHMFPTHIQTLAYACASQPMHAWIGYFDMGSNLAECPEPLEHFAVNGSWYCRRTALPCTSVHFSSLGKNYTAVCGMVEGYQFIITLHNFSLPHACRIDGTV